MKGIEVKSSIVALVSMFLLIVLLYTWFLPAINGTSGINNSSTLWFAGVNYSWFAGALVVTILIVILLWFIGLL